MSQPLFRKEALDAHRTQFSGGILLAHPPRLWLLALLAFLAAVAALLFLCFGSYTRRSTVTGQLVPSKGLVTVVAPTDGVIAQLDRIEGETLIAGDQVAIIETPRLTPKQGDSQATLQRGIAERREGLLSTRVAQQSHLEAQANGLRARLLSARRELQLAESEVATRQEQSRLAKDTLSKIKSLEGEKFVSEIQIKQQESAFLEYTAQTQAIQRQANIAARTIAEIEQALHELPSQERISDAIVRRDLAELTREEVENSTRSALTVNASVAGMITMQAVKRGQSVQAGQPILSVLPSDSPLEAELLVPSRSIGFIEPGDAVHLRYQAYPYQKFGHHFGRVLRVSRSTVDASEARAMFGTDTKGESFYRVVVALPQQSVKAYGKHEPLMPGMVVDADVLGERRLLIEWLVEPLLTLNGST